MSTGLPLDAAAGKNAASSARTFSENGGTTRPFASHASAHRIAGPPALVRMPTRLPAGSGWLPIRRAVSKSSARVSVRITPACWNSASTVTSEAESSAPVCEEVARLPACVRPPLTARIGLLWLTRRATRANLRGFPSDSRYSMMRPVSGSDSQNWSRSVPEMSAFLRPETNEDMPEPIACARAMTAIPRPPLCDRKPTRPLTGVSGANVASRLICGDVVMTPMQLGPTQPHAGLAADLEQLTLQPDAVGAGLAKAGRDHDQSPHTFLRALPRHLEHVGRGHGDDRQLHVLFDVQHGCVRGQVLDRRSGRVDGVRRPGEAHRDQVVKQLGADRSAGARGADHGHRSRSQQVLHRRHGGETVTVLEMLQRVRGQAVRKRGVDLTRLRARLDREAALAQDVQHAVVLRANHGL